VFLAPVFAIGVLMSLVSPPPAQAPRPATTPQAAAVGEAAPSFDYVSADFYRRRLSDLTAQGNVLLVLGGSDAQLLELERQQPSLQRAGIVAVAVSDEDDDQAWQTTQRLGLTFSLLSDPGRVIAGAYGCRDPRTRALATGWFVVDREGRVRGSGRGTCGPQGWLAIVNETLGTPELSAAGGR